MEENENISKSMIESFTAVVWVSCGCKAWPECIITLIGLLKVKQFSGSAESFKQVPPALRAEPFQFRRSDKNICFVTKSQL